MCRGCVSWFNNSHGYGVLFTDKDGVVFIHHVDCVDDGYIAFNAGDMVEYDGIRLQDNKKTAMNVRLLYRANSTFRNRIETKGAMQNAK